VSAPVVSAPVVSAAVVSVAVVSVEQLIDVVVVTHQSAAWIGACLDSVVGQEGVGSVVVVDTASTDATADVVNGRIASALPTTLRFVGLGTNPGFGAAANRGVAGTAAAFVLILNPDLVVGLNAPIGLARRLSAEPRLGVVGPRVDDLDGTPYPSARSFPDLVVAAGHAFVGLVNADNRWSRRYLNPDRVDWVSGTAMAVRRSAFEAVGGFDESYFMYVEDVDLCWRLARAGWGVAVEDAVTVRHAIGGSSETAPYRMIVAHHRSLWRFARRTTTRWRRLLLPVVGLGLLARTGVMAARRVFVARPPARRRPPVGDSRRPDTPDH
jgi:N-acetylglucosaminyl-diphospho-decaprenol L-rhamnosyltransferase